MHKETLLPRERWECVLKREKPDRVPMDYWATEETTKKLCAFMGCDFETVCARLHIDTPLTVGGIYTGPTVPEGQDVFGVQYKEVDYGTGKYLEVANAPLSQYQSVEEIETHYQWPNPDWWDYSHLPEVVKGNEHRPIRGGGSEPFLIYKNLRGEEQAFLDILMAPEIVHYCLDKLFDLAYENTRRIFETIPGKVLITYVAEDLGGQNTLLFSLEHIREFFLPRMKRMMDLTRQHGSYVFTHSDGAIREVIPDLIQIGMQVLNPVQWPCPGMDRESLKRDFGDQIIFHGGVDNQHILPFGSREEVRQEVLTNYATLGKGGGYILCPCHNIQPITPPENIVTMYETGYETGWQS